MLDPSWLYLNNNEIAGGSPTGANSFKFNETGANITAAVGNTASQVDYFPDGSKSEVQTGESSVATFSSNPSRFTWSVESALIYSELQFDIDDFTVDINDGTEQLSMNDGTGFYFVGTRFRIAVPVPSTSTDTCFAGMFSWDANYIYVCVADDTWKRSTLASW